MPIRAEPNAVFPDKQVIRPASWTAQMAHRGLQLDGRLPVDVSCSSPEGYTTKTCAATKTCADTSLCCDYPPGVRETIGTRIEALARARGLPEGSALAAKFKVSYETLRKWREGATAPNRNRAEQIAAILGVPSAAFMHDIAADPASMPTAQPVGLTDLEVRMLAAFRQVLSTDKEKFVDQVEARAAEIAAIAKQMSADGFAMGGSAAPVMSHGKRRATG